MAKNIKIDKKLAQKVIETVTPGLCSGLGDPKPGKMCVEAAVNFACGLPHDDSPPCVGNSVRTFKISLNDNHWSSNKARAKGMIKIAIAQLGSNKLDQTRFEGLIIEEFTQSVIYKRFEEQVNEVMKDKRLSSYGKMSKIKRISEDHEYKVDNIASYEDLTFEKSKFYPKMSNDKYYTLLADICLNVLKKMKSPGCKYLYLLNKK